MASIGDYIREGAFNLLKKAGKKVGQSIQNVFSPQTYQSSQPVTPNVLQSSSVVNKSYPQTQQLGDYLQAQGKTSAPFTSPTKPQLTDYPATGGKVPSTPMVYAPTQQKTQVLSNESSPAIPNISPEVTSDYEYSPTSYEQTQNQTQNNANLIAAEKARSEAEKTYQDSLKISADELSTQEDLDKLIESAKLGYQNTKNQAIPMEFITGQLKSVEERANLLKEPLEQKLARLQAARTSSIEASKFALERADKKLAEEQGGPGVQEVSAGASLTKYNPATGQYETAYTAPKESTSGEGFTLGEGQTRYDAYGNLIASSQKSDTTGEMSAYQTERANRTIANVDDIIKDVSGWTTGVGSLLSMIPGTAAKDFQAKLNTLKSNIAFGELTAMREASKTGGALGQVSDREGKLLESALGALDQAQSTEQFKSQLLKIKESIERWMKEVNKGSGSSTTSGSKVVQTLAGPVNTDW